MRRAREGGSDAEHGAVSTHTAICGGVAEILSDLNMWRPLALAGGLAFAYLTMRIWDAARR